MLKSLGVLHTSHSSVTNGNGGLDAFLTGNVLTVDWRDEWWDDLPRIFSTDTLPSGFCHFRQDRDRNSEVPMFLQYLHHRSRYIHG